MDAYDLIRYIAAFRSEDVFNPWGQSDEMDEGSHLDRQHRLLRHFDCDAQYLLVGEAPGYQGCHFSGVAFTNEALVYTGAIPRIEGGKRFTTRERPWSEPSASIVWGTLHKLGIADKTVLWNAFAWHPHKPGEPMSNRAPTTAELKAGASVLRAVCEQFPRAQIIAVGRVAEKALETVGMKPHAAVRHPSMGGATKFRNQMRELCDGGE